MKELKANVKRFDNEIQEVSRTIEHNGLKYVVGCGGVFGGDVDQYQKKITDDTDRVMLVTPPQKRIISVEEVML